MKKNYMNYLTILFLVTVIFTTASCSKEKGDDTNDEIEYTLPKEAYKLQFIEIPSANPLSQEEYGGTLGNVPIKLVRADVQTLLFYIPASVPVGKIALNVPQLKLSQHLEVKEAKLQGEATVVLEPLFEKISTEHLAISNPGYATYLGDVNTAFLDYYQTLSEQEKHDMALFYQVNKALFSELTSLEKIGTNPIAFKSTSARTLNKTMSMSIIEKTKLVTKFSSATYLFASSGAMLLTRNTRRKSADRRRCCYSSCTGLGMGHTIGKSD